MTRDLCYYFERSYLDVYNAFLWAAKDKFGKDCKQEEGKEDPGCKEISKILRGPAPQRDRRGPGITRQKTS